MDQARSTISPPGGEKDHQPPELDVDPTMPSGEPSPDDLNPPKEEPMSSTSSESPAKPVEEGLKPLNCKEIDKEDKTDERIKEIQALPSIDENKVYANVPEADKLQFAFDKKKTQQKADEKMANATSLAKDEWGQAENDYAAAERKYNSEKEILGKRICLDREEKLLKYNNCLKSYQNKNCPNFDPKKVPEDKQAICFAQLTQDLAEVNKTYFEEMQKIEKAKSAAQCKRDDANKTYDYKLKIAEEENKIDRQKAEVKYHTDMSGALAKCTT